MYDVRACVGPRGCINTAAQLRGRPRTRQRRREDGLIDLHRSLGAKPLGLVVQVDLQIRMEQHTRSGSVSSAMPPKALAVQVALQTKRHNASRECVSAVWCSMRYARCAESVPSCTCPEPQPPGDMGFGGGRGREVCPLAGPHPARPIGMLICTVCTLPLPKHHLGHATPRQGPPAAPSAGGFRRSTLRAASRARTGGRTPPQSA